MKPETSTSTSLDSCCSAGCSSPATPGKASANDSGQARLFKISTMDCSAEESEIRRALEPLEGIRSLGFQLGARTLKIDAEERHILWPLRRFAKQVSIPSPWTQLRPPKSSTANSRSRPWTAVPKKRRSAGHWSHWKVSAPWASAWRSDAENRCRREYLPLGPGCDSQSGLRSAARSCKWAIRRRPGSRTCRRRWTRVCRWHFPPDRRACVRHGCGGAPSSHPIRWPGKWQAWPSPH